MSRGRLARLAAPAAFLAALTIAVLLIRSGLEGGRGATTAQTVTQAATTAAARPKKRPRHTTTAKATTTTAAVYYTVQSGDTFGSIAARYGTSVQALEALNPDASPTALTVGERIRVK